MNARLSSLLVAGGVVLAGIQSGSLKGAIPETGTASAAPTVKSAAFLPSSSGTLLHLEIPGFAGVPRLQVLNSPNRVVVDLPNVKRGDLVSKKAVQALAGPLIRKSRMGQFQVAPEPVTRLVLEVAAGTSVQVSSDSTGIKLALCAGTGSVKLNYAGLPAANVQVASRAPEAPASAPVQVAGVQAPVTAPVQVAEVQAPVSAPVQAAEVQAPVSAPVQVAEVKAAPLPATPVAAAAPAVSVSAPAPAAAPEPVRTARLSPLAPVPALTSAFQTLPNLTMSTLLPVTPGQGAAPAMRGEGRREDARGSRTLGETQTRYTGTRMTIDVVGTDLQNFLRIIADTAKMNLICDQDVQGTYTIKFTDAPWDLVLDVILKNAGLGKEVSNGIIRVAKVEKLQKEEEDRKRLEDAKALAGDLQSISRPLSFAKAGEAKLIIDKVLTKRGSLIVDERTNTLIISDLPRNLPLIEDLIAQLDVQIQQVQIEARVVEATKNLDKEFGVKWPTGNSGDAKLTIGGQDAPWIAANSASWNSINNRPSSGGNVAAVGFSPGQDQVTSLSSPAGQFWVSFLSSRVSINAILQGLEKQGVVKIVSSPKVVTQNNKKAKILSGAKIPYPSQQGGAAGGAITVSFADANLELEVTPQITNDGTILMDIRVEKADADFSRMVGSTPTITRKAVETQVLVKDGGTAIMGGVYSNKNSNSTTGVPFLSKLPLLGWLFRNKIDTDANDELLVFITPRVLKN